ncbi:MAG: hypothetical protein KBC95_03580 [Candidatus Peribacteraceae bacterium]|nr:hypothetical protein [Candidatus Peribacteraceae bacterium]
MTTTAREIDPAIMKEAKRLWTDVVYAKPPATWWMYNCAEFKPFYEYLDANNLTCAEVGVTEADIKKIVVYRHMLAAEEAWRLTFKNDSGTSVEARLTQMQRNLMAAGKTREDLGLLDDYVEWPTQHPDLSIALMNLGRLKWIPRAWDHVQQKFICYEFAPDGTLKVRGS